MERSNGYGPNTNHPGDNNESNSAEISPVNSWAEEKKSLIDSIMALKTENQMLVQNLKDTNFELNTTNASKHELEIRLEKKDSVFSATFNDLNRKLHNAAEKEANIVKSLSDLKRNNSLLVSQNKQMQNGLTQAEKSDSDSNENNCYEVDALLDDKLVSERYYLVRWKGFDAADDTWERESNLSCASILKKYKQSKKKH